MSDCSTSPTGLSATPAESGYGPRPTASHGSTISHSAGADSVPAPLHAIFRFAGYLLIRPMARKSLLIGCALLALPGFAQTVPNATYVGSAACQTCHPQI